VDELATLSIGTVAFQGELGARFGLVFDGKTFLASKFLLPMCEIALNQ
jgi:hypothetical protein